MKKNLTEQELERRRAYHREYRRTHPEKVHQWRQNAVISAYRRMIEQGGKTNG